MTQNLANKVNILCQRLVRVETTCCDKSVKQDIGCRVTNNLDQNIASTSSFITVAFGSEQYDTDNMHSNTVNNSRITFNTSGKYLVGCTIGFGSNSTGTRACHIKKNGTTVLTTNTQPGTALVGGTRDFISASTVDEFEIGDFIEVEVAQDSGSTLTIVIGAADFYAQRFV